MTKQLFAGTLLVCDMDGTLLNSRHEISSENRQAIRRFVDLGGWFTVATGRMIPSVRPYLSDLPVNVPAILYNGSMIYHFADEMAVKRKYLPDQVRNAVEGIMRLFPGLGIEVYTEERVYFLQQNDRTRQHQQKENLDVKIVSPGEIPDPWIKVMLGWEPELLQELKDDFAATAGLWHLVFSEPQFLEILPAGATKGDALKELMAYLGIPHSAVVAMGDNLNDLEMLQTAGTGFAVANAHPDLKSIATYGCVDHNQHAVADVIRWIEHSKEGIR